MNANQIIELIDNHGLDINYRAYSGRAMYDKQCFAITSSEGRQEPIDAMLELIRAAINDDSLSRDDVNGMLESLAGASTDSMGLGSVLYFPDLEYVGRSE